MEKKQFTFSFCSFLILLLLFLLSYCIFPPSLVWVWFVCMGFFCLFGGSGGVGFGLYLILVKGTIDAGYIDKCLWRPTCVLPGLLLCLLCPKPHHCCLRNSEIWDLPFQGSRGGQLCLRPFQGSSTVSSVGKLYLFFHSSSTYVVVGFCFWLKKVLM